MKAQTGSRITGLTFL